MAEGSHYPYLEIDCLDKVWKINGEIMETDVVTLDSAYILSEDVVARTIEGELIIVPLTFGIGDMEEEIYTLNETGRAIWEKLDGQKSLREMIEALKTEFEATPEEIEGDVLGLMRELLKRRMVVEA
ncbi:MAG: PqqD family protein [Methanosarcina sp.]